MNTAWCDVIRCEYLRKVGSRDWVADAESLVRRGLDDELLESCVKPFALALAEHYRNESNFRLAFL